MSKGRGDPIRIKLRNLYHNMINRCYNPLAKSYKYYGERGIQVCDEWKGHMDSFIDWVVANGWKPGLQIDRKDNDKDYSPDNCRFVTTKEQRVNQRKTSVPSEVQTRRYTNPVERAKTSTAVLQSWTDPDRYIKQTIAMKASWKDPDRMDRGKAEMRKRWADPEYKKRVSEAISKAKLAKRSNVTR